MTGRGKEGGLPAAAACLLFSSFVLGPRAPLNFPALAAADNFSLGTVKTPSQAPRRAPPLAAPPPGPRLRPPPPPPLLRRPPPANEGQTHPPPRPAPPRAPPSPERWPRGVGRRRPPPEPRSLPSSAPGSAAAVHKLEIVRLSEREGGRHQQRGDGARDGGREGGETVCVLGREGGAVCKVAKLVFRILNSTFHMPLW